MGAGNKFDRKVAERCIDAMRVGRDEAIHVAF